MIHTSSLPHLTDMPIYPTHPHDFFNPYPSPTLKYKQVYPASKIPVLVNPPDMSEKAASGQRTLPDGASRPLQHPVSSPFTFLGPQQNPAGYGNLQSISRVRPSSAGLQPHTQTMTPPSSSDLNRHHKDSFSIPQPSGPSDPQLFASDTVQAPQSTSVSPLFEPQTPRRQDQTLPSIDKLGLRQYVRNWLAQPWDDRRTSPPTEDDYILVVSGLLSLRKTMPMPRSAARISPTLATRANPMESLSSPSADRTFPAAVSTSPIATASSNNRFSNATANSRRRGSNTPRTPREQDSRVKPTASRQRRPSSAQPGPANRRVARAMSLVPNGENKSSRAKSTKPTTETDYTKLPDYSPSPSTMKDPWDAAKNEAQVRAFGGGMVYDNDPDRHLLSDPEAFVASRLGLTCERYLLAKRLILQGFVRYLRNRVHSNENWNKTAAQKCCNIDVSKTSAIYNFFNLVGWFDDAMHEHYMHQAEELG